MEVREVEGKGRGCFATAAAPQESVMLSTYPDCAVLYTAMAGSRCGICFAEHDEWFCDECSSFGLCNQCDSPETREWHSHECARFISVPPPMRSGDTDYLRFVLRYGNCLAHGPPPGTPPGSCNGAREHFSTLSTNKEVQTDDFLAWAVQFAGLFKSHGLVDEGISEEQLAELFCRVRANALGFPFTSEENLGWALEVKAAMLNHSCLPNCYIGQGQGGVLEVRTKKPVQDGEELTISYLDMTRADLCEDIKLRQENLMDTFRFTCSCELCTSQMKG
eukprot:TRINITY_DN8366_c0_g1_i2.p1 TRINITY_DN8366_c0_g1~~TRINITY_DN8366_c0_g1_i2.p1  ORF type:complete len:277 (+),score=51.37 TRINITY_DN8366_c0_g1_i2:219-1049(+)